MGVKVFLQISWAFWWCSFNERKNIRELSEPLKFRYKDMNRYVWKYCNCVLKKAKILPLPFFVSIIDYMFLLFLQKIKHSKNGKCAIIIPCIKAKILFLLYFQLPKLATQHPKTQLLIPSMTPPKHTSVLAIFFIANSHIVNKDHNHHDGNE